MIEQKIGTHKILIELPEQGLRQTRNAAIFLNDGGMLSQFQLQAGNAVLFGIVPNDRLSEYTPWHEKAIKPGAPDFGGQLSRYHAELLTEILPPLVQEYHLDSAQLAYGGFSLGGLAAVLSLWETERFRYVFSLCGSFWYPSVLDFMAREQAVSRNAELLLLNGAQEGKNHNNRLGGAAFCAKQAHQLLKEKFCVTSVIDEYAHHERKAERLQLAVSWLEKRFSREENAL